MRYQQVMSRFYCIEISVKHLIFEASKFGDFKTLTFWRCLILPVSQFNVL